MTSQGTNGLPKELENALVRAKGWYDKYGDLDALTDEEREISASKGADILADIVEAVDRTWGFAQ